MPAPVGRSVVWRVGLVGIVVINTVVMWSDAVAAWWSDQTGGADDGESILPGFVTDILSARPELGDADLHAIAWAAAGFVAVMAARRSRSVAWLVLAVWAWSVAVEALQPLVSDTRQFAWTDLVGNSLGIVLGAVIAAAWRRRRVRRRDEGPWSGGNADVTMAPSRSSRRSP
jgi:hypothetical protein